MKYTQEQQEKYLQMQMMAQQIKATREQLQELEMQEHQISETLESLDNFKSTKIGSEIFVPMNTGIFAKAELKDNTKLLINVGSGVVVEKDVDGTKKIIETQIQEIRKVRTQLTHDLESLAMESHHLEHEIAGTKCEH
jgi:prefoldin alpha subunit